MDEDQLRRRVAEARVARVGTVDEQGRAHLVPIVFVVDGDRLYSATDDGPRPVKRLRNLQRDPTIDGSSAHKVPALGSHAHGVHARLLPVQLALLSKAVQDPKVKGVEHPGVGPLG